MSSERREYLFGDLLIEPVRNGVYKKKEYHGRGAPVVNMKELFALERIDGQHSDCVELTQAELARFELVAGDLLFARRSFVLAGAGKCAIVGVSPEPMVFESSIIRARVDSAIANPEYLYHFFKSRHGRALMASIATRTAVSGITGTNLSGLKLDLPSVDEQRMVAAILGNFDKLIENSSRRIRVLDEMAHAVFREWFVEFRYPGHEYVPLVDSSVGPIPEGWDVSSLSEVLAVLESGSRPKGGIDPHLKDGVPSIGAENVNGYGHHDFSSEKFITVPFFEQMRAGTLESGDVLLYKDGAHIGRHSMVRDSFPHARCAVNEHVFRIRVSSPLTQNYLYYWIDLPRTVEQIVGLNSNAAQPGVSQAKLRTMPIFVPPAEVVARWDEIVDPLVALVAALAKSIRALHDARELLLPRLTSGEIDVFDLELPEVT